MTLSSIQQTWYSRSISACLIVTFVVSMVITPRASYAQGGVVGLPEPGTMVNLSPAYVPLMLTGLRVHPSNPLLMDFIVSTGNSGMNVDQVKTESDRLIKYFLACLTIPEKDQWVNLSPYEKQRIIPEDLGQTVLGQDMLAQDYILKQLTASLIYPEKNLGKNFWDKVYAKASQMYGTTQVPVNTFNKVWILPDTAKVYEHNDTALVTKSHLTVMLDEDYLSLNKHAALDSSSVNATEAKQAQVNNLGSQIVRQIILPAIEQEVNTGKNFAQLRQIYNSMILAVWYKQNLKEALLNQVYTDKAKVNGVNVDDPAIKEKIYKQYLEAYKKGVFNYIKEDIDKSSNETIPRKYFSGGEVPVTHVDPATAQEELAAIQGEPAGDETLVIDSQLQRAVAPREEEGSDTSMLSAFHEGLWKRIKEFSARFKGATPQAMHNVIRKVRVSDIVKAGGDIKNMPQAERIVNMTVARDKIIELSNTGRKIALDEMVAGMASRNLKGLLPKLYITAMQEDPDQFVDKTKLTAEEKARVDQIGLHAFINSLNPFDAFGKVTSNPDHDALNRLLHESKALLPINKEAIKPEEYPDMPEKYRSKTGWYNFLAYGAINVARANDQLEKEGLNRVFVFKLMASELNYQKIMDNLIQNNFFGLNMPGVKRDATGKIIDIDHTDPRNEIIIYTQGMGYRLAAPVEVVEAQWQNDQDLLNQASKLTDEAKKKALYAKTQFAGDGDFQKGEANYKAALAFSQEAERDGKTVLYDSPVAEGHGERWHMQFQTNKFGPQTPNFLLDFERGIQYDVPHNVDNMANLDDNFMVIFGWMLRNKKKLVMEASMKPGNESAGGGFTWTVVNGKLVMRQAEGPEINASINDKTISPDYNKDEEARKDKEDKVKYIENGNEKEINDEMPINNATIFAELPTTVDSIRAGEDVYSANLSPASREKLAKIVEAGDYQNADLTEFGNELRSNFGALSTPKSIVVNGKMRLTLVNETLAWDIQKGLLANDQVGIVFTGSLADVRERGFDAEQARFIPLKQRPDAEDPVINAARDKVSRRILFGNFFESFLPLLRDRSMFGKTLAMASPQTVSARNQKVDIKTKGTAGWRSFIMSQLTKNDLTGFDAEEVLKDFDRRGYVDSDGVIIPKNLPATIDAFNVSDQFASVKQQLFDILTAVAKEQGPLNLQNLGRAANSAIIQFQRMIKDGTYKLKNPALGLRVLVGYDGRPNADEYARYVARVAGSWDHVSVDLTDDLIATPDGLQQSRRDETEGYDLVLVLTASHNDYRYLGLKVGNDGGIADDNITGEIDKIANTPEGRQMYPILPEGSRFRKVDLKTKAMIRYNAAFSTLPDAVRAYLKSKPNSVFVNFMHGSDGRYRDYFLNLGVPDSNIHMVTPMRQGDYPQKTVIEDGKKVYWRPQPVRPMLEDQLNAFEADPSVPEGAVYLAIDGDADRFAVWQKLNGKMVPVGGFGSEEISPNEMSLMFLDYMIKNNLVPEGAKRIVITRPTSKAVAKRAKMAGFDVITTPVGSKYLKKYMNDSNNPQAALVFEESGHGGFRILREGKERNFFDDGMAQALLFLEIMTEIAKQGMTPADYIRKIKEEINYDLEYKKIAVKATEAAKDKIRNALQPTPKSVQIMGRNITNVRELVSLIQGIVQGDKTYKVKQVLHTGKNDSLVTTEQFESGVELNPNEGLNIEFDTGAEDSVWVEVRMSGTEPIIRIYGEFVKAQPGQKGQADKVMDIMDKQFFADKMMGAVALPKLSTDDEDLDRAAEEAVAQEVKLRATRPTKEKGQTFAKTLKPGKKERDTAATAEPGGIDLNSRNLKLESEGQKVNITFDAAMIAQFKRGDFSGVKIKILDVVPINLMPLLGLKEDEKSGQLA